MCIRNRLNEKSKYDITMAHNILHDKNPSNDL